MDSLHFDVRGREALEESGAYVDALFPGVVWQDESTPPLLTNSVYQVTLPATNAKRFYRLKSP